MWHRCSNTNSSLRTKTAAEKLEHLLSANTVLQLDPVAIQPWPNWSVFHVQLVSFYFSTSLSYLLRSSSITEYPGELDEWLNERKNCWLISLFSKYSRPTSPRRYDLRKGYPRTNELQAQRPIDESAEGEIRVSLAFLEVTQIIQESQSLTKRPVSSAKKPSLLRRISNETNTNMNIYRDCTT